MKNFVRLIFLILGTTISAQNFEGIITYDLMFQDKTGEMVDEEAAEFMGTKQAYYIKGNKYKSVMNGMLNVTNYYTGKDTLYTHMQGINGLMYVNTKTRGEEVISANIIENQEQIVGYSCNLLEIKTSEGTTLYYYNKDIKVNTNDYKNHEYGLWYFCLEKTGGALPLMMITDVTDVKLTIKADFLESKNLDNSLFNIPKGLPIVKSPE